MKIYLYLADGFEEIEALATLDVLRRAELETVVVSAMETKEVSSVRNLKVVADRGWQDVDINDCSMIVLPGGIPGVDNLAENASLCKALKEFSENGKWIAAICAAPKVLYGLGLLKGKNITCFPGVEEGMKEIIHSCEPVVVDGKLITSQGPGTAIAFGLKIVEMICGMEKVDFIKEKMLVK